MLIADAIEALIDAKQESRNNLKGETVYQDPAFITVYETHHQFANAYLKAKPTKKDERTYSQQMHVFLLFAFVEGEIFALVLTIHVPSNNLLIYLETHCTLDNSVPVDTGCAEAVSFILQKSGVTGLPVTGIPGTATLYEWLSSNPAFNRIYARSQASTLTRTNPPALNLVDPPSAQA
jgi:hypothetical protein